MTPSPSIPLLDVWQEISQVIDELFTLSKSECDETVFYQRLLEGIARTTVSEFISIWHLEQQSIVCKQRFRSSKSAITEELENQLRLSVLREAERLSDRALSTRSPDEPNAELIESESIIAKGTRVTPHLAVVLQFKLPEDSQPSYYAGIQKLLHVLLELVADFHERKRFRHLVQQENFHVQLNELIASLLKEPDLQKSGIRLVNAACRLVACDRVGLFLRQRETCRAIAISGTDSVDPHASQVVFLEQMCREVNCNPAPVDGIWCFRDAYLGSSSSRTSNDLFTQYFQETTSQLIGFLPLQLEDKSQFVGFLIFENFAGEYDRNQLQSLASQLTRSVAAPIANAAALARSPLFRFVQRWTLAESKLSRRSVYWAGLLLAAIGVTLLLPADFKIEAQGVLRPLQEDIIYAPLDGVVAKLPAHEAQNLNGKSDGIAVSTGELVLVLENDELQFQMAAVRGDQATALRQLDTVLVSLEQAARNAAGKSASDIDELSAKKLELEIQIESLKERNKILDAEAERLKIRSRVNGFIQNWDAPRELLARPVRQGQRLLVISDTQGDWELKLQVPDHHSGYLTDDRATPKTKLPIEFFLKSHPRDIFHGQLRWTAFGTDAQHPLGPSVHVIADPEEGEWRARATPGSSVIAKIRCGKKPLYYVWFHDFIEFIRTRFWFWI